MFSLSLVFRGFALMCLGAFFLISRLCKELYKGRECRVVPPPSTISLPPRQHPRWTQCIYDNKIKYLVGISLTLWLSELLSGGVWLPTADFPLLLNFQLGQWHVFLTYSLSCTLSLSYFRRFLLLLLDKNQTATTKRSLLKNIPHQNQSDRKLHRSVSFRLCQSPLPHPPVSSLSSLFSTCHPCPHVHLLTHIHILWARFHIWGRT